LLIILMNQMKLNLLTNLAYSFSKVKSFFGVNLGFQESGHNGIIHSEFFCAACHGKRGPVYSLDI